MSLDCPFRPKELRTAFDAIKSELSADEAKRIQEVLRDYEAARTDGLSELIDILADTGDDPKKSEYDNAVNSLINRISLTLGTMLDGLRNPSLEAVLFRTQTVCTDVAFLRGLTARDLGDARDALLRFKIDLEKMTDVLRETWRTTSDAENRVADLEQRAAVDMNTAVKKAVNDGIDLYARAGQQAYLAVEKLKEVPKECVKFAAASVKATLDTLQGNWRTTYGDKVPVPATWGDFGSEITDKMSDPGKELFEFCKNHGMQAKEVANLAPFLARNAGMVVTDKLDDVIKASADNILGGEAGSGISLLLKMLGECTKFSWALGEPYTSARRSYLDQLLVEGTILVCFSKVRKTTDEFIQNNGLDAATKYMHVTDDDFREWANEQSTDGLRADAAAFGNAAFEKLRTRFGELTDIFTAFVSANRGKFFGPIDTDTQARLVNLDQWFTRRNDMVAIGLDQRLKDWRAQVMTVEPMLESAFSQLQSELASLPVIFQDAVRRRIDAVYSELKSQTAAARQGILDSINQSAETASQETIMKLFDRTALVGTLNS